MDGEELLILIPKLLQKMLRRAGVEEPQAVAAAILRQRDGGAIDLCPAGHVRPSSSGRASARCPVTAAAATIAGLIRWVRAPRP